MANKKKVYIRPEELKNKEIIKFYYDFKIKETNNNHELTDEELEMLNSKVVLATQGLDLILVDDKDFILTDIDYNAKYIARLLVYVIKGHVLQNANKRTGLMLFERLFDFIDVITADELARLMREIASGKIDVDGVEKYIESVYNSVDAEWYYSGGRKHNYNYEKAIEILAKE